MHACTIYIARELTVCSRIDWQLLLPTSTKEEKREGKYIYTSGEKVFQPGNNFNVCIYLWRSWKNYYRTNTQAVVLYSILLYYVHMQLAGRDDGVSFCWGSRGQEPAALSYLLASYRS